ncbi:MAG: immune inhibitor A [Chloroflexi bacterium]|nr:immune inhibitor A [Chloroflexota bacterium]
MAAPDRDLFRLTKELVPGSGDIPRTVPGSGELEAGHSATFWLMDLNNTKAYQSVFELVLITDHAYWYVEEGLTVAQSEIERSAIKFEDEIYPAVTQTFGNEWLPGIDNDPHLSILNARLAGVGGYFSSTDEYPTAVRPRSNQRETIYINALNVSPGSGNYDNVLAHELQHAIHWNADASEDTWINEGLAELSTSIALGTSASIRQFIRGPSISLVHWPVSSLGGISNYGASSLFMHFLTEHYGGRSDLRPLLAQPEDGIKGIDAYLEELGYESRFADVFREWAAANILDGEGILGYDDLNVNKAVPRRIEGLGESHSEIPQYAVEYTALESISESATLSFDGPTSTKLLPVDVGSAGCWWSNSGDSIDSTLTRHVGLAAATLEYEVWFQIEEDWDYAYVEVSVDGGQTWRIIETPATSPENPIGASFGPGYTGNSNGWVKESIDLSNYAGKDLWLRLQYVTDDAINGSGACFRDLSIEFEGESSEIAANDDGWQARGFVFTDNVVQQYFQVQLIREGENPVVQQMPLDAGNAGRLTIDPLEVGDRLIVAVGSLADKTRQPASYTLSVDLAN